MSHQGRNGRDGGPAHQAPGTAGVMLVIAAWLAATAARAQEAPAVAVAPPVAQPTPAPVMTAAPRRRSSFPRPPLRSRTPRKAFPGRPWSGPGAPPVRPRPPGTPVLEPDVQVVRFQGPPGLIVEVLAPAPIPVPIGDGGGIITVGLKRGVGYRLRVTRNRRASRRPSFFPSSRSSAICIGPKASTPANTRSASSSTRTTWTTPSIAAGW